MDPNIRAIARRHLQETGACTADSTALAQFALDASNEIDQLRVQLAACGVAALGWAHGRNEVKPGSYGWSASLADVLKLRKKIDDAPIGYGYVESHENATNGMFMMGGGIIKKQTHRVRLVDIEELPDRARQMADADLLDYEDDGSREVEE